VEEDAQCFHEQVECFSCSHSLSCFCNEQTILSEGDGHCRTQLITLCVQYRFDDEMKDDDHGAFTPEMMKLAQATWIETFVEGPIEGWIHSKRRNKFHQKLVEKLVRAHTNLVLRESLDDTHHLLLPWDIELVIDESVDEPEEEPEL
jgi:hypothetical protein